MINTSGKVPIDTGPEFFATPFKLHFRLRKKCAKKSGMDPAIEADLALLRAELALHAVMTPQCGALLTDTKGIIVYVNARLSEITGYSREKLIGQHSRILRPPNMTPVKYRSILNTANVGHCWRGDIESRRENGERYPTRMIITPLKDALGRTTHFSVILKNMTGSTS